MRKTKNAWRFGLAGVGVTVSLAAVALAAAPSLGWSPFGPAAFDRANVLTSPVRRTDLNVSMRAGGRVDSSERTIIECRLENVEYRVRGVSMMVGGSSTILSVMPEGSVVTKGDVLCEFDASSYVELVRQQQMNLDRAQADHTQAGLTLDVAKLAVAQYRDGYMVEDLKEMKGQIVLSEADMRRSADRLAWSRRMLEKGYLALGQVMNEEVNLQRFKLALSNGRTALDLYKRFTAPKTLKVLDAAVRAAESNLTFQDGRLQRTAERLDYYKTQVENCVIRAPHDGFLIFANDEMRQIRIEPGMTVHQRQKLFYLPDLKRMEVLAMIHESVVKDVQPGMRVRVTVEGLPDRSIEGHVDSVAQLATQNPMNDVKYFVGVVKLDHVPRGLMPGMTAEVDITTGHSPDVLVVPIQSLTMDHGQGVCYVAHEDGLERREVKIGRSTRDLVEVTEGLGEGDEVVLDPTHTQAHDEIVAYPSELHSETAQPAAAE